MKYITLILIVIFAASCSQNEMRFIHPESGTVEIMQSEDHTRAGDSVLVVYHQGNEEWRQVPAGYSRRLRETTPIKVTVLGPAARK